MRSLIAPETRQKFIDYVTSPTSKKGLIRMLILIIIAIIILSVLGFDIRAAIEHPQTQENFSYLTQSFITIWDNYLSDVWAVVWNIVGPILEWFWIQLKNFSWNDFGSDMSNFLEQAPELPSTN
jgi:hypothetical protein